MAMTDSLPRHELDQIASSLTQNGDDLFNENSTDKKEREIIHSNRVKLTDYVHDVTVLFPYMKQHGVFNVYDCDVIKGETVAHNRVDKFIDVLFTKGPRGVGVFHESLAKTYPSVFDYLTRLFTSAGVDLPDTRRMRPASIIDQIPEPPFDHEGTRDDVNEASGQTEEDVGNHWGRTISRRGMTVRRSLDVLSRQLDDIQKERNELKNALSRKEKEISDLIKSKEKNRDDLFTVTQHYQEIYKNLVNWKESLTLDNSQRLHELLAERECIQAEYDALENDYTLVQLELRAARERISRLMSQLERSERLVAFAHEERDALQCKVSQLEGDLQRIERKKQRELASGIGASSGKRDNEIEQLTKQLDKLQKDLEASRNEGVELSERLKVARLERSQALEEKDSLLQKHYLEEQKRKKAESELKLMYKRVQQMKEDIADSQSSDGSYPVYPMQSESKVSLKMEDFTTFLQASEDMGMTLGLGVLVANVEKKGVADKSGIKSGDQICQINHIAVTSDRDPLDLCKRLLHNASKLVSLLIRRPVLCHESPSSAGNSTHCLTMPQIHQTPGNTDSPEKHSTLPNFSLPMTAPNSLWGETVPTFVTSSDCTATTSVTTPPSHRGKMPYSTNVTTPHEVISSASTPTTHSGKSDGEKAYYLPATKSITKQSIKTRRKLTRAKRKNSEDEISTQTSSSDDPPIGLTFPNNSMSFDSNSGIVHSPENCTREFNLDQPREHMHQNMFNESTREGSAFELLGTQFHLDDEDVNFQDLITETHQPPDISVSLVSDVSRSKPNYLPLHSTPANFPQHQSISPKLKRAEARKWMSRNRKSQSLVDMSDLFNDIDNEGATNSLKLRRVILPWGRLSEGISLVGGRGRGVFIYSSKNENRGLQTGDQIFKIGDKMAKGMTYREVVTEIEQYEKIGEQCMITVHTNIEGFTKLPSLQDRDCFYVKTMFVHKKVTTGIPKEMTFNVGAIFKVIDTLPAGMGKFWRVNRVDAYGNDKEEGFVPIEHLLTEVNFISPMTSSLPNIFRNSAKRLNSHPGPDTFHSLRNEIHNVYELYQPIKKVKVNGPRPVVLLGICENEVRQALLDEQTFSLPPIRSLGSLAKLQDECTGDHVLLKRTGENVRYCVMSDIVAISEQDQHCILSIEPSQLRNNRTLLQLHPIVLFLYTKKSGPFGFKLGVYSCSSETATKYLQDMKIIEDQFSSYFTGKVEVSGGLDNIVKLVKAEITTQQYMALWEEDDTPIFSI